MGGIIAIGIGIMMGIAVAGVGIGQGIVGKQALESMARQPEMAGKLQTTMILVLGLMEALCIYALLIAFMLVAKI